MAIINKSKESVNKYFNENVHLYQSRHYKTEELNYMTERERVTLEKIQSFNSNNQDDVFIDIGCGPGELLKKINIKSIKIGMDYSLGMLKNAKKNVGDAKVSFVQADIEALPFKDNSVRYINSSGVIEYLSSLDGALSEFHRIAKQDALVILSTTNKYSHANIFDPIIEGARGNPILFSILNFARTNILKTGPLLKRQFKIHKYSISHFNKIVTKRFLIHERRYFFFILFPHPLNEIFKKILNRINRNIQFMTTGFLKGFSEGYLVVLKKR